MKAIVVLFDSLSRRFLPGYGGTAVDAPNFARLAEKTTTFDHCYAGSMPCIPARRELHTARHNFLHRSWGPLEPFDDSVPELLRRAGVYTHLVTDHPHYWEDGGATYHSRFSTFEFFRGQEGDRWKGRVADPPIPPNLNPTTPLARQDWVNRQHLADEASHPQTLTFDAGLEFVRANAGQDHWLLHLESFDPHEPFFTPPTGPAEAPVFDWPAYRRVIETDAEADQAKAAHHALVAMCDRSLGRVLDLMDELDLWPDTMLIVCTDHGFLLGEHSWWGKSVMPWYDELIHTPLHVWDPRRQTPAGERHGALVQTIDIGPTLLEFFGVSLTPDMQGRPLGDFVAGRAIREAALFGSHGGHVSVTDGRYVYMRACVDATNSPLHEYTLMPTHMRHMFTPDELRHAQLAGPFGFTKGVPVLRLPGWALGNPHDFGSLLFDLAADPAQEHPLCDDALELRLAELLVAAMRANEAPPDQFERLGLPATGPVTAEHLLVARQWPTVQASSTPPARREDFPPEAAIAATPVAQLLRDDQAGPVLERLLPEVARADVQVLAGHASVLEAAAVLPGIGADRLAAAEAALAAGPQF